MEKAITITGTSIFVNKSKAYTYYRSYYLTPRDVDRLIKNGVISVGEKELKNQYPDYDYFINSEGRYFLQVRNKEDL